MLSVTGVDKGDIVPITISIVYGSRASALKLIFNTELIRSHNVKNVLQHTKLSIRLTKSCLLLTTIGIVSHRQTKWPLGSEIAPKDCSSLSESELATRKRKSRYGSNKNKMAQRGEYETCYSPFTCKRCYLSFICCVDVIQASTRENITSSKVND